MIWLLACAGTSSGPGQADQPPLPPESPDRLEDSLQDSEAAPLPWSDSPCEGLDVSDSVYRETVDRWLAQDALASPPGELVVVGSSSIRRWERAFVELAPFGVVQRGFGGAQVREVAAWAQDLVLRHEPRAVLVYAGTNDLAGGRPVDQVLRDTRCLAEQLILDGRPVLLVGVTPNPARWESWATSESYNAELALLAEQHPRLHYVDIATPFLEHGSPPDASLFVEDQLHLSEAGYALWSSVLVPAVQQVLEPRASGGGSLTSGQRLRVDLGPSNPEDGKHSGTVEGRVWNDWHELEGDAQVLPGEHLALLDVEGQATGVQLVVAGGFRSNGLQNGGLWLPDQELLGELAVHEATVDYFYVSGSDDPGALALTGLDPERPYTLRLFASREWGEETRVSRYTVEGAQIQSATLQTSGRDIGQDGYDGNTNDLVVLDGIRSDVWGQLHVDVAVEEGSYAYLALLELEVE